MGEGQGKRGTIKLDPSATVPEAVPALRIAKQGGAVEPPVDPRHKNDRKEFAQAAPAPKPKLKTMEMRSVDVSRADPRQAPTQQVSRLPLIDRGYDPSREEGPSSDETGIPIWMYVVGGLALVTIAVAVVIIVLKHRGS